MKLAVVCCMVMVLCLLVDDARCQIDPGDKSEPTYHGGGGRRRVQRAVRDGGFRAGRARRSWRGH